MSYMYFLIIVLAYNVNLLYRIYASALDHHAIKSTKWDKLFIVVMREKNSQFKFLFILINKWNIRYEYMWSNGRPALPYHSLN